jgi:hypothetical protein
MKTTVDGKPVDVIVTVHLRWDPPLEAVIDTVPVAEVLKLECIVLNAARMARQARLQQLDQLEATLQEPPVEPDRRCPPGSSDSDS